MEPQFLTTEDVLSIHEDQIDRYGGSKGVRDSSLLFHIVQNHPFVDGNQRAGAAATLVFLDLNGIEVMISDEDLVRLVLSVAQGSVEKPEIAATLRGRARM
jgi:death-on-curing protein